MKKTSFNEFSRNLDLGSIKFSLTQREDGPNWSLSKAETLEVWYRRFLYLSSIYNDKVIVPSKDIDMFWHTHILDTQKYMLDCENLFGRYIHHFPYFGMRGEKDRRHLEKAFYDARAHAIQSSSSRSVILLSPACASFDQYDNFTLRGDHFRKLSDDIQNAGAT